MKKKSKVLLVLLFIVIVIWTILRIKNPYVSKNNFIISSGNNGGNYYKTGELISSILNKSNKNKTVNSVLSNGSVENIKNLKVRFADFGIVQRDILLQNLHENKDGVKNVSIILPLFQERFLIYTNKGVNISFDEFKKELKTNEVSIGITDKNGYTYKIFNKVLWLMSAPTSNIKYVVDDYNNLIKKMNSGQLDYLVTFSLPLEDLNKKTFVYFYPYQISFLTNRIKHLSKVNLDGEYKQTLGSWSFLIGINNSINSYGDNLLDDLINGLNENDSNLAHTILNSVSTFQKNPKLYDIYLSDIPIYKKTFNLLNYNKNNFYLHLIYILGIFSLAIFLYFLYSYSKDPEKITFFWFRYKYIVIAILTSVFLYFFSIEVLLYSEQKFFTNVGFKSAILDLTYWDLHFWIFIRNLSGNGSGIFPLSPVGKLMVSFSGYVIYIGTSSIAFAEFFMYHIRNKRRKGLMKIDFINHTIISGWNDSVPELIKKIRYTIDNFVKDGMEIVCIVEDPEKIISKNTYIENLVNTGRLYFVKGHVKDEQVLRQANAHRAKTILLLAEDKARTSDERTLLRVLALTKYCKEESRKIYESGIGNSKQREGVYTLSSLATNVYIIAQTNTQEFEKDLLRVGVNAVINTESMTNGILLQTLFNRGVTKLLNEVLQYNDQNEFYIIDLKDEANAHLRNKTFDELLLPLRKVGVLLLAIRVVYYDQNGKEIVDEEYLNEFLKKDGLERQIIINPITKTETNRKADFDDQLIVFAITKQELIKAIKRIKFD